MPFIETALVGDDQLEGILHYAAVRLRLQGQGNLQMTLLGLDDVLSQQLEQLVMSETPGTEQTRLANFKGQRIRLKMYTNEIDEIMKVNRIVLFAKEIYSSYPG